MSVRTRDKRLDGARLDPAGVIDCSVLVIQADTEQVACHVLSWSERERDSMSGLAKETYKKELTLVRPGEVQEDNLS